MNTQNYSVLPNPCGKDLTNTATHIYMQMSFNGKLFGRSVKLLIFAKGLLKVHCLHYLNASGKQSNLLIIPYNLFLQAFFDWKAMRLWSLVKYTEHHVCPVLSFSVVLWICERTIDDCVWLNNFTVSWNLFSADVIVQNGALFIKKPLEVWTPL